MAGEGKEELCRRGSSLGKIFGLKAGVCEGGGEVCSLDS